MSRYNAVTIVAPKNSGKTCYMTAMYQMMSGLGLEGFSLATDPDQDLRLSIMWDNMCKGQFPAASALVESYDFHMSYNFESVCDFKWLEYPGGVLNDTESEARQRFEESVQHSSTLLLAIDGTLLAFEAASEEEYENRLRRKLLFDGDFKKEMYQLNELSRKNIRIPPICIIITKCDLIDPRFKDAIERVLLSAMTNVFHGENRLVMISSVSLGADVRNDGPDPFGAEEPIAFAVMNICHELLEATQGRQSDVNSFIDKPRGWFRRWLDADEIEAAQAQYGSLCEEAKAGVRKATALLNLFPNDKTIYVNGVKQDLGQYVRDAFREVT